MRHRFGDKPKGPSDILIRDALFSIFTPQTIPVIIVFRGNETNSVVVLNKMAGPKVGSAPEKPVHTSWEIELKTLAALQPGWNGYSAPPPGSKAIDAAKIYLQATRAQSFEPHRVEASVMGGIGITHRRGDRKVYVEFYNDGKVHALFSERAANMQTHPIEPSLDKFVHFIVTAQGYLNA
jgi:hypothetical protein